MNDRIKELARKANMVEVEYHPGFPDIKYPANFEKFAELIVKECMACCDIVGKIEWIEPPTYELGVVACKAKIQTHFGVKL